MKARYPALALFLAVAMLLSSVAPAGAGGRDALYSRKLYGILSIGVSGWCFKEAYDARKDANDSYDRYKQAGSSSLVREFYDESKRSDTRSALMLGLGAGTLLYGFHLILSGGGDELPPPKMDRGLVNVKGVALDVTGDPLGRGMRVQVRKGF